MFLVMDGYLFCRVFFRFMIIFLWLPAILLFSDTYSLPT